MNEELQRRCTEVAERWLNNELSETEAINLIRAYQKYQISESLARINLMLNADRLTMPIKKEIQ